MPETKRPLKVFLCHAHSDALAVRTLYNRLVRDGVDAWLDKEKLLPGTDWEYEIRQAVRESDVVVVCHSKQFNQKGFRQKEVRIALEEADLLPKGEIFIIPARLEECDVLEDLQRWHWVDLFEADGYENLMRALQARANKVGATLQVHKSWLPNVTSPRPVKQDKVETNKLVEEKPSPKPKPIETSKSDNKAKKPPRKLNTSIVVIVAVAIIVVALIVFIPPLFKSIPIPTITATTAITQVPASTFTPLLPTLTPTEADTPTATTIPLPTPTLGIGSTWASSKDGMVMVYVPAGSFQMGSGKGPASSVDFHYLLSVGPAHTVYLDAFWIDQTDVTNAMYAKCANAGACPTPTNRSSSTHSSYYGNSQFDDYPVIYVDWNMAQTYCQWAGRRLPTEAEWEKTARDTDARLYPWGNYLHPTYANSNNQVGDTTSVRTYEIGKSPYGAYDMAGNVQQWVEDWYAYNYYVTLGDNVHNPQGPSSGDSRVLRGGSWKADVRGFEVIRSDYRDANFPMASGNDIGFRCARSAP